MAKKIKIITSCLLIVLFAASAWSKFANPQVYVDALKGYKLFPQVIIPFLVYYVPLLELLLVVGLLVPVLNKCFTAVSFVLMVVFEIILLSLLLRGIDADCGCFGKFGGTPLWAFVKNLFIIGLIGYSLYLNRVKGGDDSPLQS